MNISPLEIDSFLMQRPDVDRGGDRRRAGRGLWRGGRELRGGAAGRGVDAAALLRYCGDGLPAFKAPKRIVLSASLPKTERGKLDRRALAEQWRRDTGG